MASLPRILLFYDHFYPAYQAGGPVQSLVNFVRALYQEYDCYVVCKANEMNTTELLPGIEPDTWNNWEHKARVYYQSPGNRSVKQLKQLIQEVRPDIIFINGLYSLWYNILPLRAALSYCSTNKQCRVVLSARGMLLQNALEQKAIKKKLFLFLFRLLDWPHKVTWHATDEAEARSIQHQFGTQVKVQVAENFPNLLSPVSCPPKQPGELIMGTIALISPMKNHRKVLEALQQVPHRITWYIFGPVKDASYWADCQSLIQQLPEHILVQYKGPLEPSAVQQAMDTFQVFIMPSESENFGHALFEALSAGKPVITTDTTPFLQLQQYKAGYTISQTTISAALPAAINKFAAMDAVEFEEQVQGAAAHAQQRFRFPEVKEAYRRLFN
jgi:glycosyltransferase involved in cell wall biosynthesis